MLPTWEPLQTRAGAAARSSAPGDCGYGRRVSTETGAEFPRSGGESESKKKHPTFFPFYPQAFHPQNRHCTWRATRVSVIFAGVCDKTERSRGGPRGGVSGSLGCERLPGQGSPGAGASDPQESGESLCWALCRFWGSSGQPAWRPWPSHLTPPSLSFLPREEQYRRGDNACDQRHLGSAQKTSAGILLPFQKPT